MRALIASLSLLAAPASAQGADAASLNPQIVQMQAEQQLARMREVATANELMALEARLRADDAVRLMQAARSPVTMPALPYPDAGLGLTAAHDIASPPSIPDTAMADSNRRVQEILKNPH